MAEAAAFSAARSTGFMAGERVMTSARRERAVVLALRRCTSPASRRAAIALRKRHLQALGAGRLDHEIGGARAHRRHDIIDAAMGGLHDHRRVEAAFAHARQDAEAVEIGHHQVEHHAIDLGGVRRR